MPKNIKARNTEVIPSLFSNADQHAVEQDTGHSFAGGMVLAVLPHERIRIHNPGLRKDLSLPIVPECKSENAGQLLVLGMSNGSRLLIYMNWGRRSARNQCGELETALSSVITRNSAGIAAIVLDPLPTSMVEAGGNALSIISSGKDVTRGNEGVFEAISDIFDLYMSHNRKFLLPRNGGTWYFPESGGNMSKKTILINPESNFDNGSDIVVAPENSHNLIPAGIPMELLGVWETIPEKEKAALEEMDPDLRISFIRSFRIRSARRDEEAKNQGDEIRQAIMPGGQPQPEQLRFSFSPFPTQLTRTSPFFPLSTQELANREYMRDMIIASHSWGTLTYTGPKLSVYEEDYLMILLALLCDENARIEEAGEEGEITYTYDGNIREILKLKGIENPGSNYYKLVIDAFTLLSGASFKLTTKKSGKGKRESETTYVNNILSNFVYKHGSGNIKVSVNPYFYQTYGQGMVTWIDVQIRARLKKPNSKALFRFIMSHRDDVWEGPLLTLAASANIDLNLPKIKIRERLRGAIGELVSVGVLIEKSKINGDSVELWRSPRSKQKKLY